MTKKPAAKGSTSGDVDRMALIRAAELSAAELTTLRSFTVQEVNNLLHNYKRTRNVVHFWRAWISLRRAQALGCGISTPSNKLKELDRMAAYVVAPERGGSVAKANAESRRHARMQEVWLLACRANREAPSEDRPRVPDNVFADVAKRHRLRGEKRAENLKTDWSRWWSDPSSAAARRNPFAGVPSIFKLKQ